MSGPLTPEALEALPPETVRLLDLRGAVRAAAGTVTGAETCGEAALVPDGRTLVVFGETDAESEAAAQRLRARGFPAAVLQGGYPAWLLHELDRQHTDAFRDAAEGSLRKTYRRALMTPFIRALQKYALVNAGDRVAVCVSGGKDSTLLAKLFQELRRWSDVPFEVTFLCMDPGYSPLNRRVIECNARNLGIPLEFFGTDIFDTVYRTEKNPCYLCARMRRGHLYKAARDRGCNKIALGHHFDDVIETTLMGMLYGAQIQTMLPKVRSTNYPGMELIRPLYFVREDDIRRWRDRCGLHFLQCACRFTEHGAADPGGSKRAETKALIRTLKKTNPDVEHRIFRSMENVNLDMVLGWRSGGVKHTFLERGAAPDGTGETKEDT